MAGSAAIRCQCCDGKAVGSGLYRGVGSVGLYGAAADQKAADAAAAGTGGSAGCHGRRPLAWPYFQKIEKQLQQGIPLEKAWYHLFSTLPVGSELLTALELTGDEEKLTAALLYTARQLKDCCQRRRQEQRQGTKLWLAGALSGAGLLIILLM